MKRASCIQCLGFILASVLAGVAQTPPLHWWRAENNTSDSVDTANGTLHADAIYALGLLGQSFSMDGTDDFVDFGTSAGNLGTDDFTVVLWVKLRSGSEQVLIEKYIETLNVNRSGWGVTLIPPAKLAFYGPIGGNAILVSHDVTLQIGRWNHLAVTRNNGVFSLYWNGILQGTYFQAYLDMNSTATLKLGHRGNSTDTPGSADNRNFFMTGEVDELQIYNRPWSQDDIRAYMIASMPLSISTAGANVALSWPATPVFRFLESNPDLLPAQNWTGVGGTPTLADGRYSLIQPMSGNRHFFRMMYYWP